MVFAYPLLRRNVAKHISLLLLVSSHAFKTLPVSQRYRSSRFFRSLLGFGMKK